MEIWSGGQTGVDRAALDVAMQLGFPTGGWVPLGRIDENGRIPETYTTLREAAGADWSERTQLNVRDTDATLVLAWGEPGGGTLETIEFAKREGRPLLVVDLERNGTPAVASRIEAWLRTRGPFDRLNVAGPRASKAPLAYDVARRSLLLALRPDARTISARCERALDAVPREPVGGAPDDDTTRAESALLEQLTILLEPKARSFDPARVETLGRKLAEQLQRLAEMPPPVLQPPRRAPGQKSLEDRLNEYDAAVRRIETAPSPVAPRERQRNAEAAPRTVDEHLADLEAEVRRIEREADTQFGSSARRASVPVERLQRFIELCEREAGQHRYLAAQCTGDGVAAMRRAELSSRDGRDNDARAAIAESQRLLADAEHHRDEAEALDVTIAMSRGILDERTRPPAQEKPA